MSCGRSSSSAKRTGWSKKSTSTKNFIACGTPEDASNIDSLRMTVTVEESSGAIKVAGAYRYTDDKITFDAAVELYSGTKVQTNDGTTYGASFVSVTSGAKEYIQPGVLVWNDSGDNTEIALIGLKVDRKS